MTDVCLVPISKPQTAPCACTEAPHEPRPASRPRALTQALFDAFHNPCCLEAPPQGRPWRPVEAPPRLQPPKG